MGVYWPYTGYTDYGDCICTAITEDGEFTGVRVEKADPRVLISGKLLADFHKEMQFGSLTCAGTERCPVGDTFAIDGINQRVVYVVVKPEHRWLEGDGFPNAYIAEWPD